MRDKVYPALDRQIALVKEMQKHAVHDAGVWRLPDGEAYYRASLQELGDHRQERRRTFTDWAWSRRRHNAKLDVLMKAQGMTKGRVGERLRAMFRDPRYLSPPTPMRPRTRSSPTSTPE